MSTAGQPVRPLPRAAAQVDRADRMLSLLVSLKTDWLRFRDLLPYVLELLLSGSRMIQEESKSKRTAAFAGWWDAEPLVDRHKIEELRHAELKQGKAHTSAEWKSVINASPEDFPTMPIAQGDTVSTAVWFWEDGPFAGQQVPPTLETYLASLRSVLAEAERLLAR